MKFKIPKSLESLNQAIKNATTLFRRKSQLAIDQISTLRQKFYRKMNKAYDGLAGSVRELPKRINGAVKSMIGSIRNFSKGVKGVLGRVSDRMKSSVRKTISSIIPKRKPSSGGLKMPESQGGPRAMSGLISMGGKFVASMNLAGTAITGLINGIIKVGRIAGKFETVRISLKFLTGSAKSARIALSQMMDFANKSPFDHDEVIEAGRILLKYGQDAGSVSKTLSMLGEVAAGSGSSLGTIAEIYGRMMKDGKAGVNELNELTASGVPIIEQLAKQYGKTNTEILRMAQNGEISAEGVKEAFEKMSGAGGKFHAAVEEYSDSFEGKLGNFKDEITELGKVTGEIFLPALKKCLEVATFLAKETKSAAATIKDYLTLGGDFKKAREDAEKSNVKDLPADNFAGKKVFTKKNILSAFLMNPGIGAMMLYGKFINDNKNGTTIATDSQADIDRRKKEQARKAKQKQEGGKVKTPSDIKKEQNAKRLSGQQEQYLSNVKPYFSDVKDEDDLKDKKKAFINERIIGLKNKLGNKKIAYSPKDIEEFQQKLSEKFDAAANADEHIIAMRKGGKSSDTEATAEASGQGNEASDKVTSGGSAKVVKVIERTGPDYSEVLDRICSSLDRLGEDIRKVTSNSTGGHVASTEYQALTDAGMDQELFDTFSRDIPESSSNGFTTGPAARSGFRGVGSRLGRGFTSGPAARSGFRGVGSRLGRGFTSGPAARLGNEDLFAELNKPLDMALPEFHNEKIADFQSKVTGSVMAPSPVEKADVSYNNIHQTLKQIKDMLNNRLPSDYF